MELFFSKEISDGCRVLDKQESNHCIKVLRHRQGDEINVSDGRGNLYRCVVTDPSPTATGFSIENVVEGYGSPPYTLPIAVAPPKNPDRFEWFAEKATEIGVDEITPLVGDYSERKIFKGERTGRIVVSAAKQSHKGAVPSLGELCRVKDFLQREWPEGTVRLICYCDDPSPMGGAKIPITAALEAHPQCRDYVVMIGPEGDFSREEIQTAVSSGWQVVSLGESRLRIETAALTAVSAVYLHFSR